MKLESKYDIGNLVEYIQDRNDEYNLFGFITEITHFKSDAVNYSCRYNIQKVNGGEIDNHIIQENIIKVYHVR
jgi:hypothetical protein